MKNEKRERISSKEVGKDALTQGALTEVRDSGAGSRGNRALRVAVIGLGALGNELVKTLGLAGAGEVLLVDPDVVEESNLTRSAFFRKPGSVGRKKAQVLLETAGEWFPGTRWEAEEAEIADVGWGRLEGRDLLLCGVDRDSARLEVARIATRLGVPVCDGGLSTANLAAGRATWFPGGEGACFCCRLGPARRRELLASWSSRAQPCHVEKEGGGWTSTPAAAAVAAAIQVEMGLRWLLSGEKQAVSVEFALAPRPALETIRIPFSAGCPFHDPPEKLAACEDRFEGLLGEGEAALWEWPVCLRARCRGCGEQWRPAVRAVKFRREGKCPRCGSGDVLELESAKEVGQGSALARSRPEELGLPVRHLYSIRKGTDAKGRR